MVKRVIEPLLPVCEEAVLAASFSQEYRKTRQRKINRFLGTMNSFMHSNFKREISFYNSLRV
jgi:hypothetical protein